MKLLDAIQDCTGSFVNLNGKRYYVGNIFDTPFGHDGERHPVVKDFGFQRIFGNFGAADGTEYRAFRHRSNNP